MKRENAMKKNTIQHKGIYWTIFSFALVGLIASFTLSIEEIVLLKNSAAQLTCNFSPLFNCASVMKTPQGSLFGFPNPFIGIAGFSVLLTIAVSLLAGFRPARWFKLATFAGISLATIFAYWLFFQSVFVIEVLCPWCLAVTTSMTILFEAVLRWNLREQTFGMAKKMNGAIQKILDKDIDKLAVAVWIVLGILLIVFKFNLVGLS